MKRFVGSMKQKISFGHQDQAQGPEYDLLDFLPSTSEASVVDYSGYIKAAIEKNRIRNIGIIGDYGVGKSSQIAKCLSDQQFVEKYRPKTVSFLSISEKADAEDGRNGKDKALSGEKTGEVVEADQTTAEPPVSKSTNNKTERIQYEIVKQLFYGERANELRGLGIKRVYFVDKRLCLGIAAIIAFIICALLECLLLKDGAFYKFFGLDRYEHEWLANIVMGVSVLLVAFSVYCTAKCLGDSIINRRVKAINVAELSMSFEDGKPDFEQYADFLINYFAITKTRVVFFEDLDRFKDVHIFEDLRQLNYLINESKTIKNRVVFVYTTNSSIFEKPEDRTKLFDITIPIIPFLSRISVSSYIEKGLKELGVYSQEAAKVLSLCVATTVDMRVIKSLVNRYNLLRKAFSFTDSDDNKVRNCASIVLIVELYPEEYEKLMRGISTIDDKYIEGIKLRDKDIKEQKNNYTVGHLLTKNKELIKQAFLDEAKKRNNINKLNACQLNGKRYDFGSESWLKAMYNAGEMRLSDMYGRSCVFVANEIKSVLNDVEPLLVDSERLEAERNRAIAVVANKDPFEYSIGAELSNKKGESEAEIDRFINGLILNKYLDSGYVLFLASSPEVVLEDQANMYIVDNIRLRPKQDAYDIGLTNIARVILGKLRDADLEQPGILNKDLVDEMLGNKTQSSQHEKYMEALLSLRKMYAEKFKTFIKSYLLDYRESIVEMVGSTINNPALELYERVAVVDPGISLDILIENGDIDDDLRKALVFRAIENFSQYADSELIKADALGIDDLIESPISESVSDFMLDLHRRNQKTIKNIEFYSENSLTTEKLEDVTVRIDEAAVLSIDKDILLAYMETHEASFNDVLIIYKYAELEIDDKRRLLNIAIGINDEVDAKISNLVIELSIELSFVLDDDNYARFTTKADSEKIKRYLVAVDIDANKMKGRLLVLNDFDGILNDNYFKVIRNELNLELCRKIESLGLANIHESNNSSKIRMDIVKA